MKDELNTRILRQTYFIITRNNTVIEEGRSRQGGNFGGQK